MVLSLDRPSWKTEILLPCRWKVRCQPQTTSVDDRSVQLADRKISQTSTEPFTKTRKTSHRRHQSTSRKRYTFPIATQTKQTRTIPTPEPLPLTLLPLSLPGHFHRTKQERISSALHASRVDTLLPIVSTKKPLQTRPFPTLPIILLLLAIPILLVVLTVLPSL